MMQNWKNGKNPNFGTNFGPPKFFSRILPHQTSLGIVPSYHQVIQANQFTGKLVKQTWENGKKTHNFGLDSSSFGPTRFFS